MTNSSVYPAIEDHALIGDGRACALVDRSATMNWLCLPDFSSPAIFGALLDIRDGGCFAVRPTGPFRTERRYRPGTAVLETDFHTDGGILRVTDCMPVGPDPEYPLSPQRECLRCIECLSGRVEVGVKVTPRPDYSRGRYQLEKSSPFVSLVKWSARVLQIVSDLELWESAPGLIEGRAILKSADRRVVSLGFVERDIAVAMPPASVERRIERTARWWRQWSLRLAYDGPYREVVTRSAITIKLLTHALSGAVIAAPTTSLPEAKGAPRNWDYRYCWLRDAALTLQSFFNLGLTEEGERFFGWLMHASQLTRPRLRVLYDAYGRKVPNQQVLENYEGWRGSAPVHVGNRASRQLQLDVYGMVIHAADSFCRQGGDLGHFDRRALLAFGKAICALWERPENGIWELPRRHQSTFGKATCWIGLDLLCRMAQENYVPRVPDEFASVRDGIRSTVLQQGFNRELNAFTADLNGSRPDASLLLLSRYGFIAPDDPRMVSTARFVEDHLSEGCLLRRFPPGTGGLDGKEGAFGICSFWRAEYWARAGEREKAEGLFESLIGYASDLGLYAEEIDPGTGSHLGNFPQAFTHVGLIDAAFALDRPQGRKRGAEAA